MFHMSEETDNPIVEATAPDGSEFEGGTAPDQLALLKSRADLMGIAYSPKIGLDTLQKKVNDKLNPPADEAKEDVAAAGEKLVPAPMTAAQKKMKIRDDMKAREMKLVRLRITNLNPSKKDLSGEIFTIANSYLGTIRKFIPYGEMTDGGYHVPFIIYNEMKARKFLNVKTRTAPGTGQIIVEQRWVNEFALEVLPQLTQKELAKLVNVQAMAKGDVEA